MITKVLNNLWWYTTCRAGSADIILKGSKLNQSEPPTSCIPANATCFECHDFPAFLAQPNSAGVNARLANGTVARMALSPTGTL